MLDKRSVAILNILRQKVPSGYAVLSKSEIAAELPQKVHADEKMLAKALLFLKENKYIEIKYQDKNEICLSLTAKADSYFFDAPQAERTSLVATQLWILLGGVFLAAFLGALIAVTLMRL